MQLLQQMTDIRQSIGHMFRQNLAMADIDDIMAFFSLKTEFQTACYFQIKKDNGVPPIFRLCIRRYRLARLQGGGGQVPVAAILHHA